MKSSPKNYIMRYKTAKNGLIAHVYEHISVDFIDHFETNILSYNLKPTLYK